MKDIFDEIILCKHCKREMQKGLAIKNGFRVRYAYCDKCSEKLWHPGDLVEYQNFNNLKKKCFKVKLRVVGNSYAVTLPKEIINFIKEIEREFNIRNEEVKLMLDEVGKLSLFFEKIERKLKEEKI